MKRRVIAIAVVLAAVGVAWFALWRNEGPMWRAVMLEREVTSSDLYWVWRWGKYRGTPQGSSWRLQENGIVIHFEFAYGDYKPGSVFTYWENWEIFAQTRHDSGEQRNSLPWWPHPPLIDLREFEE